MKSNENIGTSSLLEHRKTKREDCTATFLLKNSIKGKQILKTYSETKILSKLDKKLVTHIVIDEFKDRFGKLTHEELRVRAAELRDIFPSEAEVNITKR